MDLTRRVIGAVPLPASEAALRQTALSDVGEVRGDPDRADAFRRLAELHLDSSYRLATVILGDSVEAQDAVHDAFVTAWQKWASLREQDRFEAWFRRIVVNTCRNRLRRARRWQLRDISEQMGLPGIDQISPIADQVVMRRALNQLKPDDRIVLALRYYHEMKVDDVAEAMGIRPRAVASRLHRALGRLRTVLDEDSRREIQR